MFLKTKVQLCMILSERLLCLVHVIIIDIIDNP